jgi:RNA polymerase sigma-70 factor (ECF subfamily)
MPLGAQFGTILAAATTGSEWALAALYRDLHPPLLRYLQTQAGQDAEDLASEVWLDVAGGLDRFRGDEPGFRRWVFTIARRRVVDLRRQRRRRRTDIVPTASLTGLTNDEDVASQALDALSTREALRRIADLPPQEAEVVMLRVVAGLDTSDVAAIMDKRPGTVRVLQHRALKRLARSFSSLLVTL